jgi:hypothetical protein
VGGEKNKKTDLLVVSAGVHAQREVHRDRSRREERVHGARVLAAGAHVVLLCLFAFLFFECPTRAFSPFLRAFLQRDFLLGRRHEETEASDARKRLDGQLVQNQRVRMTKKVSQKKGGKALGVRATVRNFLS